MRLFKNVFVLVALLSLWGCPRQLPQPEIDAAKKAFSDLDKIKDCAPETYMAAKATMDRAQALLKEERYDEAKTALLAAKKLAEKARKECDEKRKRDEEEAKRRKELEAQNASRQQGIQPEEQKGPTEMVTVYFGFNTSDLTDEMRQALSNNAEYMRLHPDIRVQIEGHCDERGSTEYNLSLGERRALSVKQYLSKIGVDPDRMEIISYGEERPADEGSSEEAYAHNRRAEFRILK